MRKPGIHRNYLYNEEFKNPNNFFIVQNITSTRLSQLCVSKTRLLFHRGKKKAKQSVPSSQPNLGLQRALLRKLFSARYLLL